MRIEEASETSDKIVSLKNMRMSSPVVNESYGIADIQLGPQELSKHYEQLINYRLEADDRKTPNIFN